MQISPLVLDKQVLELNIAKHLFSIKEKIKVNCMHFVWALCIGVCARETTLGFREECFKPQQIRRCLGKAVFSLSAGCIRVQTTTVCFRTAIKPC